MKSTYFRYSTTPWLPEAMTHFYPAYNAGLIILNPFRILPKTANIAQEKHDQLVYGLFGLTEVEIKIVEGTN